MVWSTQYSLQPSQSDGNDTITTLAGLDSIYTGNGHNTVNAGAGNDNVYAGVGLDLLNGEDGDDFIVVTWAMIRSQVDSVTMCFLAGSPLEQDLTTT